MGRGGAKRSTCRFRQLKTPTSKYSRIMILSSISISLPAPLVYVTKSRRRMHELKLASQIETMWMVFGVTSLPVFIVILMIQ